MRLPMMPPVAPMLASSSRTSHGDGTLSRIDPVSDVVETIRVGGPVAALAGDPQTGTLWLQLA
jgi:hypothetical protein